MKLFLALSGLVLAESFGSLSKPDLSACPVLEAALNEHYGALPHWGEGTPEDLSGEELDSIRDICEESEQEGTECGPSLNVLFEQHMYDEGVAGLTA